MSAFNVFNLDFVEWSSVNCVERIDYYTKFFVGVSLLIRQLRGGTLR